MNYKLIYRLVKDKLHYGIVCLFSLIAVLPFAMIIYDLIRKGYKQINLDFFLETSPTIMDAMLAKIGGEVVPGGIMNAISGGFIIIVIATIIAVPLGILVGIYLYGKQYSKFAGIVRYSSEIIGGIPSIIIGIIIYFWVVKPMHSFSAFAGGIALSIIMLPMIIRSVQETLKSLPSSLMESAVALGGSYTTIMFKIMLPSSVEGIVTGIIMSISRIMGEIAPLIITIMGTHLVNLNIFEPTSAVPLLIWEFHNNPYLLDFMWASSLALVIVITTLNIIARIVSSNWKKDQPL